MIRIGLMTAAKEIRISSAGDFYLMEKIPETSRRLVQGEVQIRVERESEGATPIYQIQVASFTKIEKAKELQESLSEKLSVPVAIHENITTGNNQVRIGEFAAKEDAQSYLATVQQTGYSDAFIVREQVVTGDGKITLALRGADGLFQISQAGFLFMPSSASTFLCVDGKPYRGSFDVLLNKSGRITLVNQLGVEEYLLGVVPAEMPPSSFPEHAALAAQSIAARTYALKNMGRFRSQGFDLSDDTSTQVYEGVSIEKAVTNDVIRQTAGIAIYYQDKLIDAMFMSTCGGRTEDFSNVYDTQPVPYLKSVICAIENSPEKGSIVVEGTHELAEPFLAEDGSLANRNLELARIVGLIPSAAEKDSLADPIKREEAERWIKAAVDIAKITPSRNSLSTKDIDTRAGFLSYAAESFFGSEEINRRISGSDVDYYMANLKDGNQVPEAARASLSYLMQKGLWRPNADNAVRPDAPFRRGDALALLLRWIESARPEILRKGSFLESAALKNSEEQNASVKIKWGNKTQEFGLARNPALFRLDPGQTTPISSLRLIGTEKIIFHLNSDGLIDFLEVTLSPTGASSDRYSSSATWNTTLSRSAVAEKLRGLTGNIGEFKDLKPYRVGNSGRVVQIQAVGSRKSIVLNGYRTRGALGLRDTLFTLTREFNPDGSVASFTFSGRGYGHGVGLCQVGAFGMAKAGRSYEEILKTYYQGVEIRKAY